MTQLEVIGPEHGNCQACEVRAHCEARRWVPARRPIKPFNGIMIVGEVPGPTEVSRQIPLQGRGGRLLEALLAHAAIDVEACWMTYAVIGSPPLGERDDATFMKTFPAAVHSCVSRLRAEVELVRPRVIVTLGETAMIALAGNEVQKTRQVPVACKVCDPKDRKVGPLLSCAKGDCDWWHALDPVLAQKLGVGDELGILAGQDDADAAAELVKMVTGGTCPKCSANLKRLRPKRGACPLCGGRKTRTEEFFSFEHTHKFKESAGGLFAASRLPGAWASLGVEWLVATYDPAFCLRATSTSEGRKFGGQFAARAMVDHLKKAARLAAGHKPRFNLEPAIIDQAEDLEDYLARHGDGPYIVDIETDSEEGPFEVHEIRCVGIRRAGQAETIVVDTRALKTQHQGAELEDGPVRALFVMLRDFLEDPKTTKILQNGHYDRVTMAWFWGIDVHGQEADTMLAHQVLYPDEPHDLAHLGATLTECEAWKPPKKHDGALKFESFEDLCIYNARDLAVTDLASEAMGADSRAVREAREDVPELGSRFGLLAQERVDRVYEQDVALLDLAVQMTVRGMPVDIDARQKELDACKAATSLALEQMEHELKARHVPESRLALFAPTKCRECGKLAEACACGALSRLATAPNAKELAWVLFDPAGPFRFTPTVITDKTKEPSVAKEALLKLNHEPFVQYVLEHAKFEKWRSTFIEGADMKIRRDGRIHFTWRVAGARTGRFSSQPNAQNFPKHLRGMFRPKRGRKLVGSDFDQLELRASAALSGDEDLIRRCMEADPSRKLYPDSDPHSYVASHVFGEVFTGLDPEDPTHYKFTPGRPACKCQKCRRTLLRDVTKRVIYGLNYGAGAATVLAAIYDGGYEGPPITLQTIERAIKVYFGLFPGIPKWRDGQLTLARQTYEVRSVLFDRRRIFPLGEIDETVIYNFPIQCLSPQVRVVTRDGFVPIGSVGLATDASMGQNVERRAVRLDKPAERVWETTLATGQRIQTNADHRFLVLDAVSEDFVWRAVGDIQPGDVVAQTLAVPQVFGAETRAQPEDFFWLGYWIGNGSWSKDDTIGFHFGTRVGASTHTNYADRWRAWAALHAVGFQKPRLRNALTSIFTTNRSYRAQMIAWGVDPAWRALTKRVPESVWRAPLVLRQAFLRGLFEADGTLANSPPALHSPNKQLLEDVLLLARTCGVPGRIYGPYRADRAGHTSWRLALSGSMLACHLGYGHAVRERHGGANFCSRDAVERFLAETTSTTFSYKTQQSFYVMRGRLAGGGQVNPHTLARMRERAGLAVDVELYDPCEVVKVEALEEHSVMHTFIVDDPLHRYDSASLVSRNSTASDIVNDRTLALDARMHSVDPSAFLIAQVHDALYYECDEARATDVAALMDAVLPCDHSLSPGAPKMHFGAGAQIADSWKEAA